MSTTTEDIAVELGFLAEAAGRHERATAALAVVRQALEGIPRLVALAERGLLDRALIQQHTGIRERAAAVRELHEPLELLSSQTVCASCSSSDRFVEYPCPTLVILDG